MMLPKSIAATCKPKDVSPITVALAYDGDDAIRAAKGVYRDVMRRLTFTIGGVSRAFMRAAAFRYEKGEHPDARSGATAHASWRLRP